MTSIADNRNDKHSIQHDLLLYLKDKGISEVGFSNAEPLNEYAFFIEHHHSDRATYLDVGYGKRCEDASWYDPKAHLADARSVIALLLPYDMQMDHPGTRKPLRISKASIFMDYHRLMEDKLRLLTEHIKKEYGMDSVAFCDTGPLNDKAVLLRTGTVKLLRNSLLCHPKYGSRFYIGYVITSLDLACGNPYANEDLTVHMHPFCNNCGRCQRICPNEAIEDFGYLNAKRCISFLTQSRDWEILPEDLTLDGYVYGCDSCQLVCPLNGVSLKEKYGYKPVVDEEVHEEQIQSLSNREFRNLYGASSAGWIGKKRFLRNCRQNRTETQSDG